MDPLTFAIVWVASRVAGKLTGQIMAAGCKPSTPSPEPVIRTDGSDGCWEPSGGFWGFMGSFFLGGFGYLLTSQTNCDGLVADWRWWLIPAIYLVGWGCWSNHIASNHLEVYVEFDNPDTGKVSSLKYETQNPRKFEIPADLPLRISIFHAWTKEGITGYLTDEQAHSRVDEGIIFEQGEHLLRTGIWKIHLHAKKRMWVYAGALFFSGAPAERWNRK